MGIQNKDGALYVATGVDNSGLYSGKREAIGIIKAMAGEITSFDVFGGIGISAGIAFAKAAQSAYDFEKQFQQSMKEVATLSSGIKGSLTDYMNQVMDITREVPVQANEAAKALYQIVSAGHDGADGMKILEVSAKAAVGGVTDTATAADAITTILNAYKMDAGKAKEVSDQLFTTVRLGKTDFGQLGTSIAQAAPIAASFGIDIKEVLAAVASITKQGVPTSEAMTKIRAAILGAANQLGDAAFKGRTFQEALQLIYDNAGGSSTKMKELLGTDEALQAALMITGKNALSAAKDLDEVGDSAGAAEAAFKEMASSAQNQLQLLQNNITSALRPMGEAILKEVSDIASSFNEAFANGDVQESMKTLGALIVTVTGAFVGYKGSIMAVNAIKKIHASLLEIERYEMVLYRKAIEAGTISENLLTAAQVKEMATRKAMIATIELHTAALKRNIAALANNPYVLAAIAVAGLGYAVYSYTTRVTAAEKAQIRYNKTIKANQQQAEEYKNKISSLVSLAKNDAAATHERYKALIQLRRLMPSVFKDMDLKKLKDMDDLELTNKITEAEARRNTVVAKTNLVLAKQRLQKIDNKIIRADNSGGYTGALKEERLAAAKEVEQFQKIVDEMESDRAELTKAEAMANAEASIQNKAYWEKLKKEAQEKLDALTDIEAAGKKGAELKAKINEYDKKINAFSTNASKQDSEAEKLRQQRERLTQEIERSAKERQEAIINSEFNIQQAKIDLMEEGSDKELAQIQLNYERQYKEISDRERWLLEKIQEEEKKRWERDNPDYEKKGMKFTPTTTSLSPEQREPFDKEYSLAYQKQEKDTQNLLDKLLAKYRDYDAQRTAIEKDGNAEIAYLQSKRTDDNANEIDRAINVAKQKIKEGVQAVNDAEAEETSKDNSFLRNLFGDTSQMAFKDLQKLIDQAKQLQAYLSGSGDSKGLTFISPEQLKTIEQSPDELDKLKKALDKLLKGEKGNEWEDIFDGFTKGFAKLKSSKGFKETSEALQDIGESASKASSMIGGVAGNLASMFEAMGNTGAAEAMTTVQDAMSSISNIGQGFAKGGPIGGIAAAVGEAVNWIGKAFAANARHKAALKEIMNETIAQQREYNLLLMQQNLEYEKASTIFGTDVYGKAANAVTVMKDAVADLNKELRGSGEYEGGYIKVVGRTFDTLSKSTRKLYDSYAGLANIEIKTGHKKTGLFGWGKGKDIYSSILDVYPELIKSNGEFDASLAEIIINTRTMSDESKNALQNMIDLANQAKEAYEAINDYFTDIFGDLGATMMDALVDSFKSSTDAAQTFVDSISGMLETLGKQMIYTVTLAPLLEGAQNKMMEVMKNAGLSDEEKFGKWTEILAGLADEAIEQQELADKLLEEYKKMATEKGFDIFQPGDTTKEAFDAFISQMQSAFTSLDVTAKDVSNNIYDYFRQAMINALYEKEYKGKMEELYNSFTELSKDGLSEGDMAQLSSQVDQYIEQMMKGVEGVNDLFADKLKDAEDLQSFVDNVKSAMSSIEATAEDVTDNIFEYIRQQMIDKMFADTFQPQIEAFYKKVQEAMSDGDVTDAERNALRSEAEKLANDIVAAKDILSGTLGITESNLKKELEEEFKSFSDGILNSLTSAEVTAEAVAKNISESMRKELIEAMYVEQYEPRIKAIWEKWKEYSEDGLVTDEERANIKNDIDELSKEVADAAGEISDAWKDSGEEVKKAFDSFSDSIKSVLYDAEATAEDVANNIYKFMRNALVDSMFAAQLQPQIQAWYDQYTKFMEDGAIDTAERKTLDEMIADIQKAGMEIVDAANGLFPSLDTGAIKRAEEAAQEAENARNEAEQEWESFSDDILNSLYDIEATAEDISDDMGEYMRKALIKAMYVENFKPQMQKWYNAWKSAMGDDDLTSEEKQTLDAMKQTMVDDMKKEVDAINQFFGTMFSQQASSRGHETISQDTGDEISGRLTGVYESSEGIRAESVITNSWLATIYSAMGNQGSRQSGLPEFTPASTSTSREQFAIGMQGDVLRRLEDIYKFNADSHEEYTDMMLSVIDHLDSIHKNTDCLPRMEKVLKEVKQYSKALAGK